MSYDVFISCKSEDYCYAEEIYNFLKNNGFNVFLANKELRQMGDSEYRRAISQALKSTYHLIVFASKPEYVDSTWVYYEWDWFLVAKIKGKKQGQILTILKDVSIDDVNGDLWKYESKTFADYQASLISYVETPEYLERKRKAEEQAKLEKEKQEREQKEKERIEKVRNEISEKEEAYFRYLENLEEDEKSIIAKYKEINVIDKVCPVCDTSLPLESTYCKKCGWAFYPSFINKSHAPESLLFLHRSNWKALNGNQTRSLQRIEQINKELYKEKENTKKFQDDNELLKLEIEELRSTIQDYKNTIEKQRQELSSLENSHESIIDEYISEVNSLQDKLKKIQDELYGANEELNKKNKECKEAQIKYLEQKRVLDNREQTIEDLKKQLKLGLTPHTIPQDKKNSDKVKSTVQDAQDLHKTKGNLTKTDILELIKQFCETKNTIYGNDKARQVNFKAHAFVEYLYEEYGCEMPAGNINKNATINNILDKTWKFLHK